MLDVGFSELLVFGIIGLLVLGPDKLPEAARFAAKWYSKFKRAISSVQNDIDRELRLSEFREQMQNEMKRIQELEIKMQAQMQELKQQSISTITPETAKKNNTLEHHYHYINIVIPTFYCSKTKLRQQDCHDRMTEHQVLSFKKNDISESNLESNVESFQKNASDLAPTAPVMVSSKSPSIMEVAV